MSDTATGSETTATETTTAATEVTPTETTTPTEQSNQHDADQLGDAGKKALTAERKRADAAEKALKAANAKITEAEHAKLSDTERAKAEAAQFRAEAEQARAEALRFRIATKHGITDEDAELFLTATDEETLTRQAERLSGRNKDQQEQQSRNALHVPGEGNSSGATALNSNDLENAVKAKLGIN